MDVAEAKRRQAFKAEVEAHFRAHPYAWIPAADLMDIGGAMAWRTRISDCRKLFKAEGGALENRQFRSGRAVISEYRYMPQARQGRDSTVPDPDAFTDSYRTNEKLF